MQDILIEKNVYSKESIMFLTRLPESVTLEAVFEFESLIENVASIASAQIQVGRKIEQIETIWIQQGVIHWAVNDFANHIYCVCTTLYM